MQMEARVGLEPTVHGRCFMSGIIVDNQMEVEIGRGVMVDQLQKAQELAVSMARHAGPNDLAIEHIQRRKQGRGAMALIVMRHCTGATLLHRQAGLAAIEGLDLAFFVDAKDQRLFTF